MREAAVEPLFENRYGQEFKAGDNVQLPGVVRSVEEDYPFQFSKVKFAGGETRAVRSDWLVPVSSPDPRDAELARLRHELKAQREGMGREIGRLVNENSRLKAAVAEGVGWAKELDRWSHGWCPTHECCAKSVAPIAEAAAKFARTFGRPDSETLAHASGPGPDGEGTHQHARDCYDDAGPGRGGVSLICGFPDGEGSDTD